MRGMSDPRGIKVLRNVPADACVLCGDGDCDHAVTADDVARLERRGILERVEEGMSEPSTEDTEAARAKLAEAMKRFDFTLDGLVTSLRKARDLGGDASAAFGLLARAMRRHGPRGSKGWRRHVRRVKARA